MPDFATSYGAIYMESRDDPRVRGLLAQDPQLDGVVTGLLAAFGLGLIAAGIGVLVLLA